MHKNQNKQLLVFSRNSVKKGANKSPPITSIRKIIRNNLDLNNFEYSQRMIRERIETTVVFMGIAVVLCVKKTSTKTRTTAEKILRERLFTQRLRLFSALFPFQVNQNVFPILNNSAKFQKIPDLQSQARVFQ